MSDIDPLGVDNLRAVGDRMRQSREQIGLDIHYHGHPLRRIARELVRPEVGDDVDVAWMLYELVMGEAPTS